MLTSTLYRYFYILFFIKYIQICSSIYSTKMADTRLWRSSFVAFVWGLRQAARIMRKIISYCRGRRRNWETGKANALDFRLAASWACLLQCSYCYPAHTQSLAQGGSQFKLFVGSVSVSVSFSLIKKCSRHYPFGKMLRIVFVLRGVLTLVSRLPHVVSAPITISVVLMSPSSSSR